MAGIRRALIFTSAERYTNLTVNFLLIAVVSRLLTPSEVGVWAFGVTIIALVETLRDVPSSYLVQQKELTNEDCRTAFTVMMLISLALSIALFISADWIAESYEDPKLSDYFHILAIAILIGPFERPIMALFRREINFARYSIVNVTIVLVNAATVILLAWLGFSYLSFAWAVLLSELAGTILALSLRPDFWILKPSFKYWRRAVRFGGYTSGYALLQQANEMVVPYVILSRFFTLDAVGFYNRALTVSTAPIKLLLAGLIPVIFPALAAEAREGRDLKVPFLLAISYTTVVYWPAFLLLALLAHPAIEILVGPQWFAAVPLVQIMALATLFSFASILIYPTLMATGALGDLLLTNMIAMPISAIINGGAASFGLMPLALSLLITVPLQNFIGLLFVRKHISFQWRELIAASTKSAFVACCTIAIPILDIAIEGFHFDMSIGKGILLGVTAVFGWLIGIWLCQHPIYHELIMILGTLRKKMQRTAPFEQGGVNAPGE